jgi:excisionase family DNA binding protein
MGQRHPNPWLVKTHRSYTVEELARLLGVHKNTVRRWQGNGLRAIDKKRPAVFDGETIRSFLQFRRAKAKRSCPPEHLYCLRCRSPKLPASDMLGYVPISAMSGNLQGICPTCYSLMNRRVNLARSPWLLAKLDGAITDAGTRLKDTVNPSVNGDFRTTGEP